MTTEDQPTKPESTTTAPPAEAKNTDSGNGTQPGPVPYERFAEVNNELKSLTAWKAEQEQAEAKRQAAAKAADEKRMTEQQQFAELAQLRESERDDAAAKAEAALADVTRYQTALTAILEERRKNLPKHLLTLLDKLDPVEQLQYIADNADELIKPQATPGTPVPQKRTPIMPGLTDRPPLRL